MTTWYFTGNVNNLKSKRSLSINLLYTLHGYLIKLQEYDKQIPQSIRCHSCPHAQYTQTQTASSKHFTAADAIYAKHIFCYKERAVRSC